LRRRRTDFRDLERQLRRERTDPSDDLTQRVLRLVGKRGSVGMRSGVRVALVGILTTALLITVAMLGATSYAGNGNGNSAAAAKDKEEHDNAADSQYDEKVIICHRAGGASVTLRLSREGAKAHLREHSGDYAGPCH
jgi:hypothetical protein